MFAQPDVAQTLTTLAYYHRGLNPDELLAALTHLLKLGANAQSAHYSEWLELARAEAEPGTRPLGQLQGGGFCWASS